MVSIRELYSWSIIFLLSASSALCSFVSDNLRCERQVHLTVGLNSPSDVNLPDPFLSVETPIQQLKRDLLLLADRTNRGFRATSLERQAANNLITEMTRFFDSFKIEPLREYYTFDERAKWQYRDRDTSYLNTDTVNFKPSLSGKWTLVYTDAPDITGLDTSSRNSLLPPLAVLGRIGQDNTEPPFIKNVIEWKRPDWATSLGDFFAGNNKDNIDYTDRLRNGDRDVTILQYVVTEARAFPETPSRAELDLVGIQVESRGSRSNDEGLRKIFTDGLLHVLLDNRPINLRSPLRAPFGKFEVLFLDEEMRIVRTGQNFVAVNVRDGSDWF